MRLSKDIQQCIFWILIINFVRENVKSETEFVRMIDFREIYIPILFINFHNSSIIYK